jgi:hypothetical protein
MSKRGREEEAPDNSSTAKIPKSAKTVVLLQVHDALAKMLPKKQQNQPNYPNDHIRIIMDYSHASTRELIQGESTGKSRLPDEFRGSKKYYETSASSGPVMQITYEKKQDMNGNTSLLRAIQTGNPKNVEEALLSFPDIRIKNHAGRDAILEAQLQQIAGHFSQNVHYKSNIVAQIYFYSEHHFPEYSRFSPATTPSSIAMQAHSLSLQGLRIQIDLTNVEEQAEGPPTNPRNNYDANGKQ